MKNTKFLSAAAAILALLGSAALADSCKKDNTEPEVGKGTVSGVVTNNLGTPIIDVEVSISGTEIKATTSVDGSYTLENVPMTKQTISFKKEGYAEGSSPINASSFKDGKATVDMVMDIASAKITGKCIDAKNNNAGMAGVTVKLNGAKETQTDADGIYVFEGLTIDDYNLVFSAPGCVDVVRSVSKDQFVGDFVVTLPDVRMGAKEILPGATAEDLSKVDVWHYNEYRGGKNGDNYPHFDWSTDYMATFTSWYGWHQEQNEGTTIQVRNREEDGDWAHPADHENFDSYLVGRKKITADNCILAIRMRTHDSSEDAPCHWGVMVIDISAADPVAELIGGQQTSWNDSYSNPDPTFDLSKYINKEVVIAIGVYRWETGNYYKQLVLRRLAFAKEAPDDWNYLPGEAVSGLDAGYKMTMEMVRSTMPVTEFSEFTGLPQDGWTDIDGPEKYRDAYAKYRTVGHFAGWWSCMPVQKDNEPQAGEGFVMKTRGGGTRVSTTDPESYFYAKFAIAAGHNNFTLKARNFSSVNATFFKLTAITEDGTVKHIIPTASAGEAAADGCWKFCHEDGSADNPDAYATFSYDLSEFNGKSVVLALAVFKGEANDDENKLSIYGMSLK